MEILRISQSQYLFLIYLDGNLIQRIEVSRLEKSQQIFYCNGHQVNRRNKISLIRQNQNFQSKLLFSLIGEEKYWKKIREV